MGSSAGLGPNPPARIAGALLIAAGLIQTALGVMFAVGAYFPDIGPLSLVALALISCAVGVIAFGFGDEDERVTIRGLARAALVAVMINWVARFLVAFLFSTAIGAGGDWFGLSVIAVWALEALGLVALLCAAPVALTAVRRIERPRLLRWAPLTVVGTHALAAVALANPLAGSLYNGNIGAEVAIAVNDVTTALVAASWLLLGVALFLYSREDVVDPARSRTGS